MILWTDPSGKSAFITLVAGMAMGLAAFAIDWTGCPRVKAWYRRAEHALQSAERVGGPVYRFPVPAQQIVTLRFRTPEPVAEARPLTEWDEWVPPHERPALHEYLKDKKGHPPRGS